MADKRQRYFLILTILLGLTLVWLALSPVWGGPSASPDEEAAYGRQPEPTLVSQYLPLMFLHGQPLTPQPTFAPPPTTTPSPPPVLDHFDFEPVANQVAAVPFNVTLHAVEILRGVTAITGGVTLTDTTGTISPTMVFFANESSRTVSVTIGMGATDVVIEANYGGASGSSNPFDVMTVLDHFEFEPIPDQVVAVPFNVTLQAVDNLGMPMAITGGVALTDTTGTIWPTVAVFADESSRTMSVTIGMSATNVMIHATYSGISGASNFFDVVAPYGNGLGYHTPDDYVPLISRRLNRDSLEQIASFITVTGFLIWLGRRVLADR